MAILEQKIIETEQGFVKEIDTASQGMAIDILQKDQYKYPIQSTVREITSNGVDSIRERDQARKILKGEASVEEFFVDREGDEYKASKFDASYFDLKWLSDEPNVKIELFERDNEDRDLLRFTDYGVGLGGKRLEGFFKLNYSTKRLSKSVLGKFGLGAKAPLSTGVDSYRMTSYYNGEKTSFDIYLRIVQPIIPQWTFKEDESVVENKEHRFANGTVYHSEETDEKNHVVIELEVKKHQRNAIKEAIQNQLLYFNSVKFHIYHGVTEEPDLTDSWYSWSEEVPVATKIFYESEDFILSDNRLFTRPHIVLGNAGAQVNYGLIDFDELELEPRIGNIGIKVNNEDIDITAARENVVWNTKTRDIILKKFQLALEEANKVVNAEMQDDDFLKWIGKNISLFSSGTATNPVLRQLAGMINKVDIESSYPLDLTIKYDTFKKMVGPYAKLKLVSLGSKYVRSVFKIKVNRVEQTAWVSVNMEHIWFSREEKAEDRKDVYISQGNHLSPIQNLSNFTLIQIPLLTDKDWAEEEAYHFTLYKQIKSVYIGEYDKSGHREPTNIDKDYRFPSDKEALEQAELYILARKDEYDQALNFLELSKKSSLYNDYDSLVVPEDWVADILTDSDLQQEAEAYAKTLDLEKDERTRDYVDHSKRRKEQNKVFVKYLGVKLYDSYYTQPLMEFNQHEENADTLNRFDGDLVYATLQPELTTQEELNHSDENYLKMIGGMLLGQTKMTRSAPDRNESEYGENYRNGFKTYDTRSKVVSLYPNKLTYSEVLGTKNLALVKLAKPVVKKLQTAIPIQKFLLDATSTGILITHSTIMSWYTAKKIAPIIRSLPFLRKFQEISPFHHKEWEFLYTYMREYNFDQFNSIRNYPIELQKEFEAQLDKMWEFQQFAADPHVTAEEIKDYALKELEAPATGALVVDMAILKRAQSLLEWATPVKDILNNIQYFTQVRNGTEINEKTPEKDFLESISSYLRSKSVEIKELSFTEVVDSEKDDEKEEDED